MLYEWRSMSSLRLRAINDLHVIFPGKREIIDMMRPECAEDWLLVAGDVGGFADIERAVRDRDLSTGQPTNVDAPG
jgi:hypothetical protein